MTDAGAPQGDKLIIANCSGFYGDRFSAAAEMVAGGPIHVLTGDYLAELTMAILYKNQRKDPSLGYALTFLKQMEGVLGACLDKGIRVVSNAGGLNPRGLAEALAQIAQKLGLRPRIAYIEGDNLLPRLKELGLAGEEFTHLDKGLPLSQSAGQPLTANAYLGAWGVAAALAEQADIVVGGRLTDAALVMGPAAWWFGWGREDWDQLAGAAVAGHIIECGTQATGGNYSFIEEVPSFHKVGFPLAEISADGSSVITKHPGSGGLVSPGTVKAQLLYEIRGPRYYTPDVIARFDTVELAQEGPDRVRVSGTKGEPPTDTSKACLNILDGHRNSMTVLLTGLDIERKAAIFEETLWASLGGRDKLATAQTQLIRSDKTDPPSNEEAFAYLRLAVSDPDPKKAGRLFSAKVVELALANIPGLCLTSPPSDGEPLIRHWPALLASRHLPQRVVVEGREIVVEPTPGRPAPAEPAPGDAPAPAAAGGDLTPAPLGRVFATRSGDKGGNANLGIWGNSPEAFAFLRGFLSVQRLKELLPDLAGYAMERHELPNLWALNFYIQGVLGDGVAASTRLDPQAKTLGEYLRAKVVPMPRSLLG
jgi:hypothetical protein